MSDPVFSLFSPRGASMLTRVGDGHWWLFELFRLLLVSLSFDFGEVRAVLEFQRRFCLASVEVL